MDRLLPRFLPAEYTAEQGLCQPLRVRGYLMAEPDLSFIGERLARVQSELGELRHNVAELRQNIAELRHNKADKTDVARLAASVAELRADMAELRAEMYARFQAVDAQLSQINETMSTNVAVLLNAIQGIRDKG
jgi:uncharacterized membrane protein